MTASPPSASGPRRPADDDARSPKLLSHEQLLERRKQARASGQAVVQCHGCFDIVHPGHIRHLRQAKAEGDVLLVSITGDVEMKKGTGRPLIPQELRAENLAALSFVDWVYVEERPTALELLEEVQPDVYVKGGEYESNSDPRFIAERETVENHGGRVVFTSGDVVFSSTALIAALENSVDPYDKRLRHLLSLEELSGENLSRTVGAFRGKRVVVVGETIVDTYFLCDRPDVAGESPIMTLRPVERRTYLGGAAIIARHLAAMGAHPVLVTGCSLGTRGDEIVQQLALDGVEVLRIETGRELPEKQRFLVGAQKVMKLDLVEQVSLDAATQDQLVQMSVEAARARGGSCDAAIIADFGQGLLSPGVVSRLCRELRPLVNVLAGDVSGRRSALRMMQGMDLLCPSESEVRSAFHAHSESLPTVAWRLLRKTGVKSALITMGADGLVAFQPRTDRSSDPVDGFASQVKGEHVPALGAHAVDALGCGDALLAAATLTLASGGSLLSAAFMGSVSAALEAQRLGNIVISARDLRGGIARFHTSHMTYSEAESLRARMPGGSQTTPPMRIPIRTDADAIRAARAAS